MAVALAVSIPPCNAAQPPETLARKDIRQAVDWLDASEDRAVETLLSLASIVSPSGGEQERAGWVAARMRAIGLEDVHVDETSNVVGQIQGRSGRAIVFITMLDDLATIEALQRSAERGPRREADRVVGPATEIQSVNAAALLAAEALVRAGVEPEHDIVFAAVAQEETGLGGMKALFDTWKDRDAVWVDVLGDGAEIVYGAGTIHWWKVTAIGAGGHTEHDDLPNANLAIARAVDGILSLPHPDRYDDTFINVGIIRSGEVFNHKPETGWFSLDLRSMRRDVVTEMEDDVRAVLEEVEADTGVRFEMHPDAVMDGGQVPGALESRLVRLAIEASRHLGYEPDVSPKGCCNMSVPGRASRP